MKLLAGLMIALALAGCAGNTGMQYSTEKTLDSGFDKYKTYAILPTTDTNYAKLLNRQKFVPMLAAVGKAEIEKKGFVLDTLNPDCLFTYHLVMNRKYEANSQTNTEYAPQTYNAGTAPIFYESNSSGISGGSAVRAGTAPYSNVYYFSSNNRPYTYQGKMTIDTLRQGSMVIDMIDAKTNEVIWRSIAEGKSAEVNLPTMKQAVDDIIPKMLRKLPRK